MNLCLAKLDGTILEYLPYLDHLRQLIIFGRCNVNLEVLKTVRNCHTIRELYYINAYFNVTALQQALPSGHLLEVLEIRDCAIREPSYYSMSDEIVGSPFKYPNLTSCSLCVDNFWQVPALQHSLSKLQRPSRFFCSGICRRNGNIHAVIHVHSPGYKTSSSRSRQVIFSACVLPLTLCIERGHVTTP